MSSVNSAATLDLKLAPSLRALGVVMVLHIVAMGLTFAAQPPKFAGLALAALFVFSWFSLRRHPAFGYGPRALRRLIGHEDGGWTVETSRGSQRARLLPRGFVHAGLIVVRFRTDSGTVCGRVLFGDEAPADSLRRLRARMLRESGGKAVSDSPEKDAGKDAGSGA